MKNLFVLFSLIILLPVSCKTPPQVIEVIEEIKFTEPEFEIVSIIIIQADLINTKFETVLKVTNPNNFDLELSQIKYELHGNGMFWADGEENNLVMIPAESSEEYKFRFSMNFIGTNRNLLDAVIAMRRVEYDFKGEAQMKIDNPRAPVYTVNFNIDGMSSVKPKEDD